MFAKRSSIVTIPSSLALLAVMTTANLVGCQGEGEVPEEFTTAESALNIPASARYEWVGTDRAGDACEVRLVTDASGWVIYLSLTGHFSGSAISRPSDLTPADGGFYGVQQLLKNVRPTDLQYEKHFFSAGLTLSFRSGGFPAREKLAKLFGSELSSLERVVYQDNSAFMRLEGECKNLSHKQ